VCGCVCVLAQFPRSCPCCLPTRCRSSAVWLKQNASLSTVCGRVVLATLPRTVEEVRVLQCSGHLIDAWQTIPPTPTCLEDFVASRHVSARVPGTELSDACEALLGPPGRLLGTARALWHTCPPGPLGALCRDGLGAPSGRSGDLCSVVQIFVDSTARVQQAMAEYNCTLDETHALSLCLRLHYFTQGVSRAAFA
jgi:hypothetical protein